MGVEEPKSSKGQALSGPVSTGTACAGAGSTGSAGAGSTGSAGAG